MAMKTYEFKVSGSGPFPIDMLRYDGCFPATEVDSAAIEESRREPERWTVRLWKFTQKAGWVPSVPRWESFGCTVVSTERRT